MKNTMLQTTPTTVVELTGTEARTVTDTEKEKYINDHVMLH